MNQTMLQGRLAIFRINYKSDFIITLNSDAGWMTPFCIKFWTGAPSQAYFAGWDGTTYTNCAPVAGEPTKLQVQFDDHNLPIGELKYQIGYHFTVADFPTTVEDEVLNQERVVISHDGQDEKVLLDFNGETAPDIQFSLPAYANEAQRIANEEQRIAHEAIRIVNEEGRIAAETTRQQNEAQRIAQETARVQEFARLKRESESATSDATAAATLANTKAQLAADKAALAQSAADLANAKAQLAADKAALAASAAQLANDKAALAQQKAEYAQTQGTYAKNQGDYAKQQGDYAKDQGDTALADHLRAEADHETAASDHTRAESDHSTASSDHTQASTDHSTATSDHSTAASDHTQAGNDHTRAESDHSTAASDHTTAGNDHTRAESDHTRAESDHAAVEVYVDSLGAYDISAAHAVGGVLATYANLKAALGTNGANIPEALRKGGMSVKFIQGSAPSSDKYYVRYNLLADSFTTDTTQWAIDNGGVYVNNPEYIEVKTDSDGKIVEGNKEDGTKHIPGDLQVDGKIINKELQVQFNSKTNVTDVENGLSRKVDKITDGVNNEETLSFYKTIESSEFSEVETDSNGGIIEDVTKEGRKEIFAPVDFPSSSVESIGNSEWAKVTLDKDGRIQKGIREDGSEYDSNDALEKSDINDNDGLPIIPNYYFENNYLDSKILEINDEIRKCAINGDAFFWITDIHWDQYNQRLSPSLIKYIREKTMITRLLCGGDISDGYKGANQNYIWHDQNCLMDFINKCRKAVGSNKVYATYGNHDLMAGTEDYDEVFYEYGFFREDVIYADSNKTAYYIDNVPQKMRYIALGEWGILRTGLGYDNLLTESVKSWFANTALDVEAGWTIVIFIHGLFTNISGTENLMPYIDTNTGTWAKSNGVIIQPIDGCTDIIDTIDNYKANGGLGDIACVLMGHWHADRVHIGRIISPATVGVPYILTQSDQFHATYTNGLSSIKAPRTAKTITEQHFEVVVIDKDTRTVTLFAIGSKARDGIESNVGELVEKRIVNY